MKLSIWVKQYDFFCTGRRGIFTGASGLQIAYVSGREAQQEPAPSHCFTSKDITALVAPLLSNSKFRGVDILLTSQWPRGVWQYGNSPVSALLCSFNTFGSVLQVFPECVLKGLLLSCPFVGNWYKVLWGFVHRGSRWQAEAPLPFFGTGSGTLWEAALQVWHYSIRMCFAFQMIFVLQNVYEFAGIMWSFKRMLSMSVDSSLWQLSTILLRRRCVCVCILKNKIGKVLLI